MRSIALSIALFSGVIASGIGLYIGYSASNPLDEIGYTIIAISMFLLMNECFRKNNRED